MSAPSFLAAGSGFNVGGSGTFGVGAPPGISDGDVMLVALDQRGTSLPATPAGWTVVNSEHNTNGSNVLYSRIASGDSGASWSWTVSGKAAAVIAGYTGVDLSNPINAISTNTTGGTGTGTLTGTTSTVANCLIVAVLAMATSAADSFDGGITVGTCTQRQNLIVTASGFGQVWIGDFAQAAAGPTGDLAFSGSPGTVSFDQLYAVIALAPPFVSPVPTSLPGHTIGGRA